jgi:hypothetical protein
MFERMASVFAEIECVMLRMIMRMNAVEKTAMRDLVEDFSNVWNGLPSGILVPDSCRGVY